MKLHKLINGDYRIFTDNTFIDAEYTLARQILISNFGFEESEIDMAIVDMQATGHNLAHFGINRMFIFSESNDSQKSIVVELKAVQAVRREFHTLYELDPRSRATKEAYDRLMSLYMGMNIDAAVLLLDKAG